MIAPTTSRSRGSIGILVEGQNKGPGKLNLPGPSRYTTQGRRFGFSASLGLSGCHRSASFLAKAPANAPTAASRSDCRRGSMGHLNGRGPDGIGTMPNPIARTLKSALWSKDFVEGAFRVCRPGQSPELRRDLRSFFRPDLRRIEST